MTIEEQRKEIATLRAHATEYKNKAAAARKQIEEIQATSQAAAANGDKTFNHEVAADKVKRLQAGVIDLEERANECIRLANEKEIQLNDSIIYNRSYDDTNDKGSKKKYKKGKIILTVVGTIAALSLLATGFHLVREIKKLKLIIANDPKQTKSAGTTGYGNNKNESYQYNYDNNVVTVTTTTTEKIGGTTITVIDNPNYEVLTTEKFEEICSSVIRSFSSRNIAADKSDIVKFVAALHANKLKQDNPELFASLSGNQAIEEFFGDADKAFDTLRNYDAQNTPTVPGPEGMYCPDTTKSLSIADFHMDPTQQALIRSVEARRNEIAKETDFKKRSDMTEALLLEFQDANSPYRLFDDSTLYYVLKYYIVPLDAIYNHNTLTGESTLSTSARSLMVQYIAPVGSTEQEIYASVTSGAKRNMMNSLAACQGNSNTRK